MSRPLETAAGGPVDFAALPRAEGETRQAWVYRLLRQAILGGRLTSGMRLPSTRALAERLAVSRSTIEVAFDQLRAEGYVNGVVGSGTYVCAVLPERFMRPARGPRAAPPPSVDSSARADRRNAGFVARVADDALFPLAAWRGHLQDAARSSLARTARGDDPFGEPALRAEVARYLGAARGIACDAGQIVIVAGIRQGLNLAARALLKPNDKVLLEDPGYAFAREIFAPYTRRVLPVPVDEAGFCVARARRHADARLVHVTPAHQSPTGVTMPVARRLELLAWAGERRAWLLEDDYDSEFNYRGAPLPALKSLDEDDRVIHCGSFNKTMFLDLRIGYAVVPRELVPRFAAACRAVGSAVGLIEQRALAAFIADGGLARHVRRSRAIYAKRRERVLAALRQAVAPQALHTSGEHGGFHFTWWLPDDLPADALAREALAGGLRLEFVADLCLRAKMPPAVMLGDSALGDESLDEALARLVAAIAKARRAASR